MKPVEVQLLESLASGVRPFDAAPVETPEGGFDFDALLEGALIGRPETTLGVRFAPSVSGMFEQSEQAEIARGVDRAAAAGVDHALILHDQRTLRVDVRNRVVLDVFRVSDDQVIDGIDGFVSLKAVAEQADTTNKSASSTTQAGAVFTPARVVRNASLVHALAGRMPE